MVSARNIKIDGDVNSASARSCVTDAAMGKKKHNLPAFFLYEKFLAFIAEVN